MNLIDKQIEVFKHYGPADQLEMLVEECAELILAIRKFKRNNLSPELINYQIAEEMADTLNVIEQFMLVNPQLGKMIDTIKENKTNRQLKRIMKEASTGRDTILTNIVEDFERNTDYLNCPDCGVETERIYAWGRNNEAILVRCTKCGGVFEAAKIERGAAVNG